jgi:hypothetical protein
MLEMGLSMLFSLLDMSSNSVRHVLAEILQEEASDDRTRTKSDTNKPDVLQTLSVRPSTTQISTLKDRRSHTRYGCNRFWICKQNANELFG